jgi:putative transposase
LVGDVGEDVRDEPLEFLSPVHSSVGLRPQRKCAEARQQLTRYFTFYNGHRPHSSLGGMTPDTAYFGKLETKRAA